MGQNDYTKEDIEHNRKVLVDKGTFELSVMIVIQSGYSFDVETAECTIAADKDYIMGLILETMGLDEFQEAVWVTVAEGFTAQYAEHQRQVLGVNFIPHSASKQWCHRASAAIVSVTWQMAALRRLAMLLLG